MGAKDTALSLNIVMSSAIKGTTFLQASTKGIHTYAKAVEKINLLKATKFPILKRDIKGLENHLGKIRSQTAKISANPIRLDIKTSRNSLKEARKDMAAIASEAQKARNYTKLSAEDMQRGSRYARAKRSIGSKISTGAKVAGTVATATVVGAVTQLNPIRKSMVFESSMADVKKATNADDKQIVVLRRNILTIVKDDKGSLLDPSQIAQIQAGGGRSGVKIPDLPQFTKDIAQASVAMDLDTSEAGTQFAKMSERMDIPIKKISILTNAFTHLENNGSNSARDLINTTSRLSGVFRGLKFKPQNSAAISNFMNTLEVSPELAATSFKILTDRFKKTDDKFGYYSKLQKEGAGSLKSIIKEITSSMSNKEMIKTFGSQGANVISNMGSKLDALDKSLNTVADSKMKTAVASEYAIKMATSEAREIAVKNKITAEAILMGDKMKGTYIALLETIPKAIKTTREFYTENKELIHTLGGVALKIGAVALAVKTISVVASPLISLTKGFFSLSAGVWRYRKQIGAVAKLGGSWLKTTAVVAYRVAVGALAVTAKITRSALWLLKGGAKMAGRAMLWMGRALLMNPIGLAVTAIAGGAYLIYKNWSTIKPFFGRVWSGIKSYFKKGLGYLKTAWKWSPIGLIINNWTPITGYFKKLVSRIKAPFVGFFNWIAKKFAWIGNMVKNVKGWTSGAWSKTKAFFGGGSDKKESKTLEERRANIPKALRPTTVSNSFYTDENKPNLSSPIVPLAERLKPSNNTSYKSVLQKPSYFTPETTFNDVNTSYEHKLASVSQTTQSKSVKVGIDNINVNVTTTDGKFNNDDFVAQVDKAMKEINWDKDNTRYEDAS